MNSQLLTWMNLLVLALVSGSSVAETFSFKPPKALNAHLNSEKSLHITADDMVVVASYRFTEEGNPVQKHRFVLYNLSHGQSLNWLVDEDRDLLSQPVAVHTNDNAIYLLYRQVDFQHEMAKYNRADGTLLWRRTLSTELIPAVDGFDFNPSNEHFIVTGRDSNQTNALLYDQGGNLIDQLSVDLIEVGEIIHQDVVLLDDFNLLTLLEVAAPKNQFDIQANRLDWKENSLFEHVQEKHAFGLAPQLQVTADNEFVITYVDENQMGVFRYSQYALDSDGSVLFATNHDDFPPVASFPEYDGLYFGQILNMTRINSFSTNVRFFITSLGGTDTPFFDYLFSLEGSFHGPRNLITNTEGAIFVVATFKPPFPELTSDTLYLQWSPEGVLCREVVVDGVDPDLALAELNNEVYELRNVEDDQDQERHLVIINHQIPANCRTDLIFYSGME